MEILNLSDIGQLTFIASSTIMQGITEQQLLSSLYGYDVQLDPPLNTRAYCLLTSVKRTAFVWESN